MGDDVVEAGVDHLKRVQIATAKEHEDIEKRVASELLANGLKRLQSIISVTRIHDRTAFLARTRALMLACEVAVSFSKASAGDSMPTGGLARFAAGAGAWEARRFLDEAADFIGRLGIFRFSNGVHALKSKHQPRNEGFYVGSKLRRLMTSEHCSSLACSNWFNEPCEGIGFRERTDALVCRVSNDLSAKLFIRSFPMS